jgi:hypothetical protein
MDPGILVETVCPHLQHVKDVSISRDERALLDLFIIDKVLSVKLEKMWIDSRSVTVACIAQRSFCRIQKESGAYTCRTEIKPVTTGFRTA